MVSFLVVDDAPVTRRMLTDLLETKGEVINELENGNQALDFFGSGKKADICWIDLLMPDISGIEVVNKLKAEGADTLFVMLSQVTAKTILGDAYAAGIEFFVHKPINRNEILAVTDRILEKYRLRKTVEHIEESLLLIKKISPAIGKSEQQLWKKRFQSIFSELGILGEVGSRDIQSIIFRFAEREDALINLPLKNIYLEIAKSEEEVQTIEQRIRRTIRQSLENIAFLGLEDYYNERFERYSSKYFDFIQVRQLINELRQKGDAHTVHTGRVNIRKFMIALYNDVFENKY